MPDELIDASAPIAVIGAGTMGAGIAQVAAVAGHPVLVYDAAPGAAERAVGAVRDRIAALVERGTDELTARLGANIALLAFGIALERWAASDDAGPFPPHAVAALDEIQTRVAELGSQGTRHA